jgi:hypothetical protein
MFVAVLSLVGVSALIAVALGAFDDRSETTARRPPPVIQVQLTAAAQTQLPTVPAPATRQTAAPYATVRRPPDARSPGRRGLGAGTVAPSPRARTASTPQAAHTEYSRATHRSARATSQSTSSPWIEAFYPIYVTAQSTFDVSWLLIASIHEQESAFSTNPTTYHGLNFAGCCGGPMQFNVTNGPVTTWDIARNAYRLGKRPALYDHRTATHPSIYDDYDSIMAAAWLLSSDGAGFSLSDSSWQAAYDYYGHDGAGIEYADVVVARAIGWSQHGFCPGCSVEPLLVRAVHEAYGEHP